jgi:hypothetical protein
MKRGDGESEKIIKEARHGGTDLQSQLLGK